MTDSVSPRAPHFAWFVARRCFVFLLLGALVGALWGALCVASAGATIGAVLDFPFQKTYGDPFDMTKVGAAFGVVYGGVSGGLVSALGFLILGVTLPASRSVLPPKTILWPMLAGMALANFCALLFYFLACFLHSISANSFEMSVNQTLLFALFGVPAIMVCGQIAGLTIGARRVFEARRETQ